jgi:hypothetical protein
MIKLEKVMIKQANGPSQPRTGHGSAGTVFIIKLDPCHDEAELLAMMKLIHDHYQEGPVSDHAGADHDQAGPSS